MMSESLKIGIASGKGGVGKTAIAANTALIASKLSKTLLIDLDLQNQGMSSLLRDRLPQESANSFESLATATLDPGNIPEVSENLFFLPATSVSRQPSHSEVSVVLNSNTSLDALTHMLRQLQTEFPVILLDCHGGLDLLSFAAYRASDDTFVVTEPDVVTFAGTVKLLKFYDQSGGKQGAEIGQPASAQIKLVVNRLPGDLSKESLDRLYAPYLGSTFRTFSIAPSVFCYIPNDDLLRESFGHYPFFIELSPKSIYCRKIEYLAFETLRDRLGVTSTNPVLGKFLGTRFRKRVVRAVVSVEQRAQRRLMAFFGTATLLSLVGAAGVIGITLYVLLFGEGLTGPGAGERIVEKLTKENPRIVALSGVLLYGGICSFSVFLLFVLWSADKVYKRRFEFAKNLRRLVPTASIEGVLPLRSVITISLRIAFLIMGLFAGFMAVSSLVVVFAGLIGLLVR